MTVQPFKCGRFRSDREHNDIEFNNNMVHLLNGTSKGDHPIVTYMLGSSREVKTIQNKN